MNHNYIQTNPYGNPLQLLSESEVQIIELLVRGVRAKEIAFQLDLAILTVSAHQANIFEKLEVETLLGLYKKVEQYLHV